MAKERTDDDILKKKKDFLIPYEPTDTIIPMLTDKDAGILYKAVVLYAIHGEIAEAIQESNNKIVRTVFDKFVEYTDEKNDVYIDKSRKNSANARKRYEDANANERKRTQTNANETKSKISGASLIDIDNDNDNDIDIDNDDDNEPDLNNAQCVHVDLTAHASLISGMSIDDADKIVDYYMRKYEEVLQRKHPKLSDKQLRTVCATIGTIPDEEGNDMLNLNPLHSGGHVPDVLVNTYRKIIDQHFKTTYSDRCNYNIIHFLTGANRFHRWNEVDRNLISKRE